MCDYRNVESLLGFETPVQSPCSEINHQETSYDIDSLLASLSQSSIVTPAVSPETIKSFENEWSSTTNFANSLTPLDQFTSDIPALSGLQDSTAYPVLCSSEVESELGLIDPELLFNLLQTDPEAPTEDIDGSRKADDFKSDELYNAKTVFQNADQSQIQDKGEPRAVDQTVAPKLEPDAWNPEPLQPLFDLGIVDNPEHVVVEAAPSCSSKQVQTVVLPTQQAELPGQSHWTMSPQPTTPSVTSHYQSNNGIILNYLETAGDESQSSTVCTSQLQQLIPQPLQVIVTQLPRAPVNVDMSLHNMINAVQRKNTSPNPLPQVLHVSEPDSSLQIAKEPQKRTVIPVVSYSRNQLTVIPAIVEPDPPQPAMSCAQLFASFSSPDEEPLPEDSMVIEEHPSELEPTQPSLKRAFVQVQNQYVLNSNGTNQAFEVQEMYKVVTEEDPIDQQPARKRQRRINIDYGTDFQCVPCGKTFGKKGSLEQHNRSYHTSEARPWHCATCGKNFASEEQLGRHVANHDDRNKKFQCSACDKRYVHWKDCERHYQSSHGTPAFRCGLCGKAFVRRDHLLAHEVSHGRRRDRELRKELKVHKREARINKL